MNARSQREEEEQSTEQSNSLWSELGIPAPQAIGCGPAPEVDRELLRRLVRQELPEQAARMTHRLIDAYPEWNEAHAQLLIEEFRRRESGEKA